MIKIDNNLKQYIETEILPTGGVVEADSDPITTLPSMVDWIKTNLRVMMPITAQNLADYLLLENEVIIPKRRNFYVNKADFEALELPLQIANGSDIQFKEIFTVLILPRDIPSGSFYYCSDDEWMILECVK